jgi:hypothetical protein
VKYGTLAVWVALGIVFGLFVGTAAGLLTWVDGSSPAAAIMFGGAAFTGAVVLFVGILVLFTGRPGGPDRPGTA